MKKAHELNVELKWCPVEISSYVMLWTRKEEIHPSRLATGAKKGPSNEETIIEKSEHHIEQPTFIMGFRTNGVDSPPKPQNRSSQNLR
eukprot:353093-Amphidinium_carterae.1